MYDGGAPEAPENKLPQLQARLRGLLIGFLLIGAGLGMGFTVFFVFAQFDEFFLITASSFIVAVLTAGILAGSLRDADETARKIRQDEEEILALKRSLDGYGEKREQ